eukprot:TRINITY_DN37982_c0_g1_i4.p2 TRINITY_DN37982_c0_g1~~TRINITY_DN37982_c0_g1_i4.p2  ORF type:complete len:248 (+),score=17.24 TRINITY_DN37982_c0_g1_i4:343-1086(+)
MSNSDPDDDDEEDIENPPAKASTYNARNKSIMYNQGGDDYPTAVRPPSHRAEPTGTAQHPYGTNGEPYAPTSYGQPSKPQSNDAVRSRSVHTSSPRSEGSPSLGLRQGSPTRTSSARASPTRTSPARGTSESRGSGSPVDRQVSPGGSQPTRGRSPSNPTNLRTGSPSNPRSQPQTRGTPPTTTSPQRGGPSSRSPAQSSQERTQWSRAHRGSPERRAAGDDEPQVSRVLSDANCAVSPGRIVHFSN